MNEYRFSEGYLKRLKELKTENFKNRLFGELSRINRYMEEDEYEEVYSAIEEMAPIVENGNIITSHGFGTLSEEILADSEKFILMMAEDISDWFLWNSEVLECKVFVLCLYKEEYSFSDEDMDILIDAIMLNFIENQIPCPDILLIPTSNDEKELENGYYILGLK